MDLYKRITSDELRSKWLIRGYNRIFKTNLNDVGSIIEDLRSRRFSDTWILGLSEATHYKNLISVKHR